MDTRETLLQNNTVDAVFATYSITPERAQKVAFAGPYYRSGDSIMVKKDNDAIKTADDLNGKTVATESNSTAALAVKKVAPKAKVLLFKEDAQCVAAVQQGRADAYVLDQGILLGDAQSNPNVKVLGGDPFTVDPYGVGLNKEDRRQGLRERLPAEDLRQRRLGEAWKATIGTVVAATPPSRRRSAPPTVPDRRTTSQTAPDRRRSCRARAHRQPRLPAAEASSSRSSSPCSDSSAPCSSAPCWRSAGSGRSPRCG